MIAIALEDMIGRELVNGMDDICIPGDDFDAKMKNLCKFFTSQGKNLSLSPSKLKALLYQCTIHRCHDWTRWH